MFGLILVPGCDSGSFVPPPPADLGKPADTSIANLSGNRVDPASSASHTASPAPTARKSRSRRSASLGSAKIVELLLAHPIDSDRSYLIQVLRREAGKAKLSFRLVQPETTTSLSPSMMAGEIRAAVERGTSGLIVEPLTDPIVVAALHEAVDQGMSVLLLDRPVAARGGKSIPCIRFGAFPRSGREMVKAVLDLAKRVRRPEPLRIILLHHRSNDPYLAERLNALAVPLKAANPTFSLIEFEGDAIQADELLQKSLAANPKLDVVFADDDAGMYATKHTLSEWTKSGHADFLFAGYISSDFRSAYELIGLSAAYGDRSIESFGVQTIKTIQSLLDGKPVGDFVDVPILVSMKPMVFVPTPAESAKSPSK